MGIPDPEWGEVICASLILTKDNDTIENLKSWLKDKLPSYQLPRRYMIQDDLPRNVMGKVTKKELQAIFMNEE